VGLIAGAAALFLTRVLTSTPALIALGASLPPTCMAAALILAGGRNRTLAAHLAAFAWGALCAASLSAAMNAALSAWVAAVAGEEPARTLVPALGGPIVEELTKVLGLIAILAVEPRAMAGVLDGVVCGALVGLGFTMAENVSYLTLAAVQGGTAGLERALWVRAVLGGFTHAVFTAAAGAGIAWSRDRLAGPWVRMCVPAAAVSAGVLHHVLWNSIVSRKITQVLCNPIVLDGPCRESPEASGLLAIIPLVTATGLAPGVLALWALVLWTRRRDSGTLRSSAKGAR
jgi:RsiW-degrading membrane proteinase PrsW (M82 family)